MEGSSARGRRKKRSIGSSSAAKTTASKALGLEESNTSGSRTRKERAGFDIVNELGDGGIEKSDPLQQNSPAAGSSSHRSTSSSSDVDHMEVEEIISPEKNRSTGASSSAKRKIPRILKGLHDEDIIPTPIKPRDGKRRSDQGPLPRPSPEAKRNRLTRSAIQPRRVSYDVEFHPIDMETRPNALATRRRLESRRVKLQKEDSDDEEADESQSLTNEKTRATRQLDNGAAPNYDMTAHPLNAVLQSNRSSTRSSGSKISKPSFVEQALDFSAAKIATDWDELNYFDKRLYTLQGGAPEDSNYLPMKWSELARILVRDGFFTKQQLIKKGGETKLKERYKMVRKGIQGKFAEIEAKEKDNLPLYWMEGFDVYDMEVGAKELYVHKNIPEHMRGIARFTSADLLRYEQDFKTHLESLQKAKKDAAESGSSPAREELEDNATMGRSSSVAFQPTGADRTSNRRSSIDWTTPSEICSHAEFYHDLGEALHESLNRPSHDPYLSAEEVGHIVDEHFSQDTPTNIVTYGRSTSGSASENDPRSSPRGNGISMTTANVAPTATMVAPLTTAELAIATTEAVVNGSQRRGQVATNSGNSQEQVEQTSELNVNNPEPSMLEICSNDVSVLNKSEKVRLLPGLEAKSVETGTSSTTQPLNGLPTKSLESQTIAGTARRQLDRSKNSKRVNRLKPNIIIHEDIPGNTPKASRYQPHNSTANDLPKENMNTDEQDEDETARSLLSEFRAREHATQLRARVERSAPRLLPGGIVSTPANPRGIRLPVPVSRS